MRYGVNVKMRIGWFIPICLRMFHTITTTTAILVLVLSTTWRFCLMHNYFFLKISGLEQSSWFVHPAITTTLVLVFFTWWCSCLMCISSLFDISGSMGPMFTHLWLFILAFPHYNQNLVLFLFSSECFNSLYWLLYWLQFLFSKRFR